MDRGLVVKKEIEINADVTKVWKALINPELIKQYLFRTEAVSKWEIGSSIIFKGDWEGNPYEDKGLILKLEKNKTFEYAYWTSFSGLEDKPENYANITYDLIVKGGSTLLSITQDNIETQAEVNGASSNWETILKRLKKVVEENNNNDNND